MAKKLTLTADSYDVLRDPDDASKGVKQTLGRGDSFEPYSDEEATRLIESGAAIDPEKKREEDIADLNRRRAALEAERERIDAELESTVAPQDLKGKDLDSALESAGLSTEGSVAEKRGRLAAHQPDQPTPGA